MNTAIPEQWLPPPAPRIGERDRLGATFVLSLLLHGMLILGLGFALEDAAPVLPTLDVMLTQTQTPLTPQQADFLAQANNQGGGDQDKSTRPREPQAGLLPQTEPGVAARPLRAQAPSPNPPPEARVVASRNADEPMPLPRARPESEPSPYPRGEEKIEHDIAMARLAAEIYVQSERYAKRPMRKFVSASTREYAWAAYLRAWVDRAERVGNLNYPDEVRRRRLAGMVILNIGIRRDGTVEHVKVVIPSGHPLLDESAVRIARLAEPYPALPKTSERVDILEVTRTWQFMPGGEMVDR